MTPDSHKGGRFKEPDVDYGESSAKLWSIYVDATKKYDRALVENWKGDMDGILIFAGLFSASVTAFLIESTKLLQTSSSVSSTDILLQMSLQLAALSNSSLAPVPAYQRVADTSASGYALRVNVLWSLSLLLSLFCALGATLIQGWARNYLHAIEHHAAPHRRARVRAVLFDGIEQSRMTSIVDGVPALLHASLFLFITGMQQYLAPMNQTITVLILVVLVIYASIYVVTSILPIIKLNWPYQTPLSSVLWHAKQKLLSFHPGTLSFQNLSLVTTIGNLAHGRSEFAMSSAMQNRFHDVEALSWTLASITEDSTLVAFIDGIPGYLCSDEVSDPVSTMLMLMTKHKLGVCISQILESCNGKDSMSRDMQSQRVCSCLRAVSALVMRLNQHASDNRWTSYFPASTAATIIDLAYKNLEHDGLHIQSNFTSSLMYWAVLDEYEQIVKHGREKLTSLLSQILHIEANSQPYAPFPMIQIEKENAIKHELRFLRDNTFVLWGALILDTVKQLNQKHQLYKVVDMSNSIETTLELSYEKIEVYLNSIDKKVMMQDIQTSQMPILTLIFEYLSLHCQALNYILSINLGYPLSEYSIDKIRHNLYHLCSQSSPNEIWEIITAAHVGNFIQLACIAIKNIKYLTEDDATQVVEALKTIKDLHFQCAVTKKMQTYLIILLRFTKEKRLEISTVHDDWDGSSNNLAPFHIRTLLKIAKTIILFNIDKVTEYDLLNDLNTIIIEWQEESSYVFNDIQEEISALHTHLEAQNENAQRLNQTIQQHTNSTAQSEHSMVSQISESSQEDPAHHSLLLAQECRELCENQTSSIMRRRHHCQKEDSVHSHSTSIETSSMTSWGTVHSQSPTSVQDLPLHLGSLNAYLGDVPGAPRARLKQLPDLSDTDSGSGEDISS